MASKLNGKTYDCVYLTAEEKVVVDAMRAGGYADVYLVNQKMESVLETADRIPLEVLPVRAWSDHTDSDYPSILFKMTDGDQVSIIQSIPTDKKNH